MTNNVKIEGKGRNSAVKEIFKERINMLYQEKKNEKSIAAMARDANMSAAAMNYYLSGERMPDMDGLRKLCSAFDCSADWLLGLTDVRSSSKDVRTAVISLGIEERYLRVLIELERSERNALLDLLTVPGLTDDIIPDLAVIERINRGLEKTEDEGISEDEMMKEIELTMKLQKSDYILLTNTSAVEYYARKVGDAITKRLREKTERIIFERIGY